ncbi:MAG: cation transporter [Anaerolineales bacterium]|nr:cation transporter [Anaerolineales bacterium]
MKTSNGSRNSLTRFAWLSIGAAVATILLKSYAYWITGSIGLFSDALESFVNLAGAIMALAMLKIAARPADEDHLYGHTKAEYFSSTLEGTLILLAALSIGFTAAQRLMTPKPLEAIGLGVAVSFLAALINFSVAQILLRASRRENSITLEANSHHLMTDVWTSLGVIFSIGIVALTGWEILDPLVALLVAMNIIWSGFLILRKSVLGLMDAALPPEEQALVHKILAKHMQKNVQYHALRTRQSGARRFVSVHVLVPGYWTVQRGHQLLERIEADMREALPFVTILTHLEPLNDPTSWEDVNLDREGRKK